MRILVVNPYIGGIRMKYRKRNPKLSLGALKLPPGVTTALKNHVLPKYKQTWGANLKTGAGQKKTAINVAGGACAVPTTWVMDMTVADTLRKYGIAEPDGWAIPINAASQIGISYVIKKGVPYLIKSKDKSAFTQFGNAYRGAAYITILGRIAVLVINKTALSGSVTQPMGYTIDNFVADAKKGKLLDALKGVAGRSMGADLLEPLKEKVEELRLKLPQIKGLRALKMDVKGLGRDERDKFITAVDGDQATAIDGGEIEDLAEEGREPALKFPGIPGLPSVVE
jgi:hypothetical protein